MEEIRLRVCHVLTLCTTIVQNVLVSKRKKRVVLCVDVRDAKTHMDNDQMLISHMHVALRRETR